jgi:Na+-translocating ferredoxin:NAD+ oxidoreductase RnfC subunit
MIDPRIEAVEVAGLVGLGGAGFPTHVKLQRPVETLIVNAAECEPLLRKDNMILQGHTKTVVEGICAAKSILQAKRCILGIKAKNKKSIAALKAHQRTSSGETIFEIAELADFYPAGDEVTLIHEVTKKVVPPGGLPFAVGVVVMNNETLLCLAEALAGRAMTHTFVTVSGEVKKPSTFRVPIGTPMRELIAAAGGAKIRDFHILDGGPMMGSVHQDFDRPITKTSSGVIVLPTAHPFVQGEIRPRKEKYRIGKSVCDQCSLCTQLCPRYLLGHPVEPHRVMRQQFVVDFPTHSRWGQVCCECGLCSLFSCPEGLFPREACQDSKRSLNQMGERFEAPAPQTTHPMAAERKVPTKRLLKRLGLTRFEHAAPLRDFSNDASLRIPLQQHIGHPAVALVKEGEWVEAGQCLASPPEGQLGARIHAPRAGKIEALTPLEILIK